MNRIAALMIAALAVLLPGGPATGQARDPVTVEVSDQRAAPGGSVQVRGEGWEPGSRVRLFLETQNIGVTTVGEDGRFSTEVTIPEDAATGEGMLRAVGIDDEGQRTMLRAPVSVTEASTRGTVTVLIVVGVILFAIVVLAAILLSRRRRAGESLEGASTQEPTPFDAGRRRARG